MPEAAGLIEKLEKLAGPDREVDAEIFCVHLPEAHRLLPHWTDEQREDIIPRYTASLDVAIALVEKVLPGSWYLIGKGKTRSTEPLYGAQIMFGSDEVLGEGEHDASLSIALLIAMFRALTSRPLPLQETEK